MSVKRWLRRDDEGAVATVFGLLLTGGVLLGFMALVVDVGQIYVERGELISGADAAALGVAKACATDLAACADTDAVWELAQRYANDNASDEISHVDQVCGFLPGVLTSCPPPAGNRTACLGDPPAEGNWVEVRLSTEVPGDRFVLPPSFAGAVIEDFDGATVGACARVSWREPVVVEILPFAFSSCAESGAPTVDQPPYPPYPDPNDQAWLGMTCGLGTSGMVLDGADSRCQITMPDNGIVTGVDLRSKDPDIRPQCLTRLADAVAHQDMVYLPVYENPGPFTRISHLARVVITGYDFGTKPHEQADNGNRGAVPTDCVPEPDDPEPWTHRCLSIVVVGQLDLSALVGSAAVDLIG